MIVVRVALVATAMICGLAGCASSHTRHHKHSTMHYTHGKSSKYHKPPHHYAAPVKPAPYTLPGGLQSVCTGGTPPPCN
jgi:hypothetical protein